MSKTKFKLALVLGGGGARGLAHIGVIRVLERAGIMPDLIVGTSMGAVVGGMYAQSLDIDSVESRIASFVERFGIKSKWLSFLGESEDQDKSDMFRDITYYVKKHIMKIKALTSLSLEGEDLLMEPLTEFFENSEIENCKIPFAAVAIDLLAGRQEVISSGSIIKAVYASAAVQGAFPPLDYYGMMLCDGGPVAIVPVEVARSMGARTVIAVDVSMRIKRETDIDSGLQVVLRSDTIAQDRLRLKDLELADLVISPQVHAIHWANFGRVKYCLERGERAAEKELGRIRRLKGIVPWWKRVLDI